MNDFDGCGLYAQGFKCFGTEHQGFDEIRRLNLIIGRNNSGKSALLDLVRFAIARFDVGSFAHRNELNPRFWIERVLTEELIKAFFPHRSTIRGLGRLSEYGARFIGSRMRVELGSEGGSTPEYMVDKDFDSAATQVFDRLAHKLPNPFKGRHFVHIAADRDIRAEGRAEGLGVEPDGRGATNLIQRVINDEDLNDALVERTLLDDLNEIMGPDATFTRVGVQRTADANWMTYLDEESKGRISLADSGSGLKTVLLVALTMSVLPKLQPDPAQKHMVFAFEELENNLHPGLQRRLLQYIHRRLTDTNAVAFVTTHSPVFIDLFSRADDAQIIYVTHDGEAASVSSVSCSGGHFDVLDDLGVRASDLLQANGVIWVEGLTDAIYIRRWIELYCDENGLRKPVEGTEFAFVEYGGRCLKHYDFGAPDPAEKMEEADARLLLSALRLSRNAYAVMDSDKSNGMSKINDTKIRVQEQAEGSWITEGREIENYVHPDVAEAVFGETLNKYDRLSDVYEVSKGRRPDKVRLALKAVDGMDATTWKHRDLEQQIGRLVGAIAKWNPRYSALGES